MIVLVVSAAIFAGVLVVAWPWAINEREAPGKRWEWLRRWTATKRSDRRTASNTTPLPKTRQIASWQAGVDPTGIEWVTIGEPLKIEEFSRERVVRRRCSGCGLLFTPDRLVTFGVDGVTGKPIEACPSCESLFSVEAP